MKLVQFSIIVSAFVVSAFSCSRKHTQKDSTNTNAVTQQGTPSDVTNPAPGPTGPANNGIETANSNQGMDTTKKSTEDPNSYGFVVSFFSPGNGIDSNTKDAYDKFLEGYKSKVETEQYRWGREGEIDYCLKLSKLSAAEKKDFIAKSRAILEKSDRVHIYENSPCVHKK